MLTRSRRIKKIAGQNARRYCIGLAGRAGNPGTGTTRGLIHRPQRAGAEIDDRRRFPLGALSPDQINPQPVAAGRLAHRTAVIHHARKQSLGGATAIPDNDTVLPAGDSKAAGDQIAFAVHQQKVIVGGG